MAQTVVPAQKIKTLAELARTLAGARQRGSTVVFANGCFDLVHVGHVRYLEGAKALGDLLVVAVNSDLSVRALKGEGRPLQPEQDRALMVASFACVDFVVVFDDPTVDNLLLTFRPDVHAKGTDYVEEMVPEHRTVLAYGGRTAIVGDPKSHATRDLIRRILEKQRRS
ncbi:MAG: adenylyltransferase/cytidyltransferase family protein [Acidobacteria bacterium]|nr:adenylyltransferase/cytidyltransferase family protein [Acidobacteriota bacterium]